jgi:hypothetical protein
LEKIKHKTKQTQKLNNRKKITIQGLNTKNILLKKNKDYSEDII